MSLDKVTRAARNPGSGIPMGLLPPGFYAWPEEPVGLSMFNVRAYLRRSPHGEIEQVGPSHRHGLPGLLHDAAVGEARAGAAANAQSYGLGRARGPMPGLQTGGVQAHAEHFTRTAQEFKAMDWWHERHKAIGQYDVIRGRSYKRYGTTGQVDLHVDPGKVTVEPDGSVRGGKAMPGMGTSPDIGHVERKGMLWHATHADGTDPNDGGGKATKSLAVKSLVDYHNQMAGKYQSSTEKTSRLEAEAEVPRGHGELYDNGSEDFSDSSLEAAKSYLADFAHRVSGPGRFSINGPELKEALHNHLGKGWAPSEREEIVSHALRHMGDPSEVERQIRNMSDEEVARISRYNTGERERAAMGELKRRGLDMFGRKPRLTSEDIARESSPRGERMRRELAAEAADERRAARPVHAPSGVPGQLAMFSGQQASALERLLTLAGFTNADEVVALAWNPDSRHVRTAEGVRMYHAPIGTLITEHMRSAARRITSEADEATVHGKQGKGLPKPVAPAGEAPARAARKAAGAAAGAGTPGHPDQVSGHRVRSVYTHPQSEHALYDLGGGLHAEGRPGESPGPVMRSQTGLQQAELEGKGWRKLAPAAKTPGAGAAGAPAPGTPGRGRSPLAERSRAAGVNPYDWNADWVPPDAKTWIPDIALDLGHETEGFKPLTSKGRVKGAGTAADPIDVKGNIERALELMQQGKHVRLNQPTEISLIMQAVNKHAQETAALPKDQKPDWDFGLLTVRGTNLFTAQHKGIPRIGMPQFGGVASPGSPAAKMAGGEKFIDLTDNFRDELKRRGIKVTQAKVPAATLRATQTELIGSKVSGFAAAYLRGDPKAVKAMAEPIIVTRDHYVVDGHHRWAANMLVDALDGKLGNDTPMNVQVVDMDIGAMIPYANDFAQRMGIASRGAVSKKTQAPKAPSAPKPSGPKSPMVTTVDRGGVGGRKDVVEPLSRVLARPPASSPPEGPRVRPSKVPPVPSKPGAKVTTVDRGGLGPDVVKPASSVTGPRPAARAAPKKQTAVEKVTAAAKAAGPPKAPAPRGPSPRSKLPSRQARSTTATGTGTK